MSDKYCCEILPQVTEALKLSKWNVIMLTKAVNGLGSFVR